MTPKEMRPLDWHIISASHLNIRVEQLIAVTKKWYTYVAREKDITLTVFELYTSGFWKVFMCHIVQLDHLEWNEMEVNIKKLHKKHRT